MTPDVHQVMEGVCNERARGWCGPDAKPKPPPQGMVNKFKEAEAALHEQVPTARGR
jgi:hypothetical protein